MFAIQPSNRLYKDNRYIGVRKDSDLPYIIYEGNADFPQDIHDFGTKDAALEYLTKIMNRDGIDVFKLTTSQVVDLSLVDNADKYYIIEYEIIENKLKVINSYLQSQFTRKGWY